MSSISDAILDRYAEQYLSKHSFTTRLVALLSNRSVIFPSLTMVFSCCVSATFSCRRTATCNNAPSVAEAMTVRKGTAVRTVQRFGSPLLDLVTYTSDGSMTIAKSATTFAFAPFRNEVNLGLVFLVGSDPRKNVLPRRSMSVPTRGKRVVGMPPMRSMASSAVCVVRNERQSSRSCQRLDLGSTYDEDRLRNSSMHFFKQRCWKTVRGEGTEEINAWSK